MSKDGQVRRVFDPRRTSKIDAGNGVVVEIVKRTRKGKRFVVVVTTPVAAPAIRLTTPPENV